MSPDLPVIFGSTMGQCAHKICLSFLTAVTHVYVGDFTG